ncbi:MAG: 30S ribosomal protein S4 [Candidatus Woesearchaeota archaeon]
MGDIKKTRKKYSKPSHPWRSERITEENQIIKEYGIPKKTELWKAKAKLESFKNQAKNLSARTDTQAKIERENLVKKLESLNLIRDATLEAILGISLKDVLNRRLQTIAYKKGYAKTMSQARQMIIHRHILIGGKINTSPSYLVRNAEEGSIEISPKSPFYDTNHAERTKEPSKRKPKVFVEKNKFGRKPRRG